MKKKILIFLIIGIGKVLKYAGVFRAKAMKFQLSFSMDLALVENIGEIIWNILQKGIVPLILWI